MTAEDALEKIKDLVLNDWGGRRDDAMVTQVRGLLGCVPTNLTSYASGKRDAIPTVVGDLLEPTTPQEVWWPI